jgi:hypothetical protein
MAFERFHPDPHLQRNLACAHDLRAAYLRSLFRRLLRIGHRTAPWRHVRTPQSAAADSRSDRQAEVADELSYRLGRRGG